MRKQIIVAIVFLALSGCGGGEGAKIPVKLEDVPAPAMKVAQEKLPGINFHEAYRKKDGTYEIRGKEKSGKVREVEVKADGTFVALE
jgi:hypothetical protein